VRFAIAVRPRHRVAWALPILSSRASTSVSTRETKNEATDPIAGRSRPASRVPSISARKASMTLSYRDREKK